MAHHGTAGDLDRRGTGDVATLTVEEYSSRTPGQRLGYRLFRNPLVMFGLGPLWSLMIGPRIWSNKQRPRMRNSVLLTNLALAVVVGMIVWLLGPVSWLLVQLPATLIAVGPRPR
jgi:omega-6 fatty acid desaturase (delta-12 desaturase)